MIRRFAFPTDVIFVKSVTASSTFADKHDAYAAWRTVDFDLHRGDLGVPGVVWSAWCEGKPDEGIGEGVTITFEQPTPLAMLRIAAGVQRSDALWKSNNQITSLEVIVDGVSQKVTPATTRGEDTEVKLDATVTTIAVKIAAVKKGKMNDSCISSIELTPKGGSPTAVTLIGIDGKAWVALGPALTALFKTHPGMITDETRDLGVTSKEPGVVQIVFPCHRDSCDLWVMAWTNGKWVLRSTGVTQL